MVTIYMPLLDEGTDVWRPVEATQVTASTYRIEGPVPPEEIWAFPPGSIVRCAARTFTGGEEGPTAVAIAD